MEKFDKVQIAIRIKPETKVKLERIRVQTGLAYGVIIDNLVKEEYEKRIGVAYDTLFKSDGER